MFALRYFEELDNKEIAALMETSQAVVAVTLHCAIQAEGNDFRNGQENQ